MDRSQRALRILEVMIHVAEESQIDGMFWQLDRAFGAQNRLHVAVAGLCSALLDMRQKLLDDIDCVNLSSRTDLFRQQHCEQASAGTYVRDRRASMNPGGLHDLQALIVDFSTLPLEALDPLRDDDAGFEILGTHTGSDALFGNRRRRTWSGRGSTAEERAARQRECDRNQAQGMARNHDRRRVVGRMPDVEFRLVPA